MGVAAAHTLSMTMEGNSRRSDSRQRGARVREGDGQAAIASSHSSDSLNVTVGRNGRLASLVSTHGVPREHPRDPCEEDPVPGAGLLPASSVCPGKRPLSYFYLKAAHSCRWSIWLPGTSVCSRHVCVHSQRGRQARGRRCASTAQEGFAETRPRRVESHLDHRPR